MSFIFILLIAFLGGVGCRLMLADTLTRTQKIGAFLFMLWAGIITGRVF